MVLHIAKNLVTNFKKSDVFSTSVMNTFLSRIDYDCFHPLIFGGAEKQLFFY
ncbi:hypothetical protein C2W64_01680 [Brevibacillus laterosporus]|nr:hypothetical protein C2W64_01680 [Brevibacillus laterosporus]